MILTSVNANSLATKCFSETTNTPSSLTSAFPFQGNTSTAYPLLGLAMKLRYIRARSTFPIP